MTVRCPLKANVALNAGFTICTSLVIIHYIGGLIGRMDSIDLKKGDIRYSRCKVPTLSQ